MSVEDDYSALKRLHDATNQAVITLQKDKMELMEEVNLLNAKLIDCQRALDINKEIMRNALTNQNLIKDNYSQEITDLKSKIKILEG
jgi:predicted  nucleic acid-binding Zn-ribbon protein